MKRRTMSKMVACESVAKGLRDFGYPDVTADTVKPILDAWLGGKRDFDLPSGVIGLIAGRQFDDVESANPGALSALTE